MLFYGITVKAAEASLLHDENTKILCLSLIFNRFTSLFLKKFRNFVQNYNARKSALFDFEALLYMFL